MQSVAGLRGGCNKDITSFTAMECAEKVGNKENSISLTILQYQYTKNIMLMQRFPMSTWHVIRCNQPPLLYIYHFYNSMTWQVQLLVHTQLSTLHLLYVSVILQAVIHMQRYTMLNSLLMLWYLLVAFDRTKMLPLVTPSSPEYSSSVAATPYIKKMTDNPWLHTAHWATWEHMESGHS